PLQVEDSNVLPNESEKSIISKRKYSRTVKRKKKGCANVLTQPHFAMSDFSPILVLQIKICIKPDRHGKGSNKI
ncbi:hypothetical protein, partial [Bacteroides faecis]|uniref:hypothetical protein n=1 Tax=Bacteroides faecis TaxID=674529 RepID=UPI0039C2F74D